MLPNVAGAGVGSCLDAVLPTLAVVASLEREPEVRLKMLTTVSTLLANSVVTFQNVDEPGMLVASIVRGG